MTSYFEFVHVNAQVVLVTFVSLFTIVNPLGAVPIFIGHTAGQPKERIRTLARKASLASFFFLAFFGITGQLIFTLMGITIPAFRIAGGVLVFMAAQDLLKGMPVRSRTSPEEQRQTMVKDDISVIPLAFPLLGGPGAITTVIVLMSKAQDFTHGAVVFLAIIMVAVAVFLILRFSTILARWIGPLGFRVINRVMGLILTAISIEFIIAGVRDLLPQVTSKL